MYVRDLVRSMIKRWYLVLIGLLLTAGLGWGILRIVPVSYVSEASMVLLPPKVSTEPNGNPYLYLGGLGQALDVLTRALDADAAREPLEDAHPHATFEIAADTSTSGPILLVTSTATTARGAQDMTAAVLSAVPAALTKLQTDLSVPAKSRIEVMTLAVDQSAKQDAKLRTQALLGGIAAGVTLTILLTGFIDGLLRARKARRKAHRKAQVALAERDPLEGSAATSGGAGQSSESGAPTEPHSSRT